MTPRRILMSCVGLIFVAFSIAFLRKSGLGTDPFTCFVVGIGTLFGTTYGVMFPILIGILLVVVFIFGKHYIGFATIATLVIIGPVAEYSGHVLNMLYVVDGWPSKLLTLLTALVFLCVGSSFYITADLGVSSYDAMALILAERTNIQFRWCRISTDLVCVVVGFFCHAVLGIGTIITAFFMGPVTQFCNIHISQPLLGTEFKGQ